MTAIVVLQKTMLAVKSRNREKGSSVYYSAKQHLSAHGRKRNESEMSAKHENRWAFRGNVPIPLKHAFPRRYGPPANKTPESVVTLNVRVNDQ